MLNIIIVGGGKVGTYLAAFLLNQGHKVKVIEIRREEIPRLHKELSPEMIVSGSGTDPDILESTGIRQADVVAAVTASDETNLVVASLARFEFNVRRTIARVENPGNAWMFKPEMGVDVALNQADVISHLIAEEMSLGEMMTLLKLRKGEYSLVEERVHPEAPAVSRAIMDLKLPQECVLVAVIRDGKIIIPHGNTVLRPEDEVLALVNSARLPDLQAVLGV
ncbi:MAG: NAD-binding protein [Pseudomonadota bacterium]